MSPAQSGKRRQLTALWRSQPKDSVGNTITILPFSGFSFLSACAQLVVPSQSSCPQPELIAPSALSCGCLAQVGALEKGACHIRKPSWSTWLSHDGNGTVEIPQLQNVDSEVVVVSEYETLKQFGDDETKFELGVLAPKDLVNVEIGHSYSVNLGVFATATENSTVLRRS